VCQNSLSGFCARKERRARNDAPYHQTVLVERAVLCTPSRSGISSMRAEGIIISPVAVVISTCDFQVAVRGPRLFYCRSGKIGHYAVGGVARQSFRTSRVTRGNSLFPYGADQICAARPPGTV